MLMSRRRNKHNKRKNMKRNEPTRPQLAQCTCYRFKTFDKAHGTLKQDVSVSKFDLRPKSPNADNKSSSKCADYLFKSVAKCDVPRKMTTLIQRLHNFCHFSLNYTVIYWHMTPAHSAD